MPWMCPACRSPIHHSETEQGPRTGVTYRCHICRLELVVDPDHSKLVLAPLASGEFDHGSNVRRAFTDTAPNAASARDVKKKR
jgi:hypothetical protein